MIAPNGKNKPNKEPLPTDEEGFPEYPHLNGKGELTRQPIPPGPLQEFRRYMTLGGVLTEDEVNGMVRHLPAMADIAHKEEDCQAYASVMRTHIAAAKFMHDVEKPDPLAQENHLHLHGSAGDTLLASIKAKAQLRLESQ